MDKVSSYHIYITPKQVAENYPKFFHYRHYIMARFEAEHAIKVLDPKKFKYFKNKNRLTGELVMEVEIETKYTEPLKNKLWYANQDAQEETGNKL